MFKTNLLPALLLLSAAGAVHAQTYRTPEFNQCVRQFYDSRMYNWLAYENTCGESITINFIPNNPGHGGGSMTLSPGRHDRTGYSRDEVREKEGFELYVCPAGYIAVDENDRYVTRVVSRFRCKRQ